MTDFDFENVEVLEVRLESGDVLAGYRIRRILADEPGVESVYEATAPGETRVAVKVRAQPQSREFRRQFRRLAAVRADLEHPNLLRFYGGGESEYGLYVVSALSQAPTLAELIQS